MVGDIKNITNLIYLGQLPGSSFRYPVPGPQLERDPASKRNDSNRLGKPAAASVAVDSVNAEPFVIRVFGQPRAALRHGLGAHPL